MSLLAQFFVHILGPTFVEYLNNSMSKIRNDILLSEGALIDASTTEWISSLSAALSQN
jgi:hypothetical protein